MLRAGLIGFPSSGKTALFQLLTSAREAPRTGGGKSDANVGVSRVPDERLDKLTALFNPRKHVPATVEFADIAGVGGARTGAQALLDVAPFRNADALLHVVRMFRDPSVPHPAGSIDPARDVHRNVVVWKGAGVRCGSGYLGHQASARRCCCSGWCRFCCVGRRRVRQAAVAQCIGRATATQSGLIL